jgi:hypothetical protein
MGLPEPGGMMACMGMGCAPGVVNSKASSFSEEKEAKRLCS